MAPEQIICVADGRMEYETFRGKWGNIIVRDSDGKTEPLFWYDASRREGDTPTASYYADHDKLQVVLKEKFGKRPIDTALLVNTFGGLIAGECLIRDITDLTRKNGGSVFAYVSTVAVSAGSAIMMQADHVTTVPDSWCMWHLPSFPKNYAEELTTLHGPEKGAQTLERFNRIRHEIHEEKLHAILARTKPGMQADVRADVERVLSKNGVRHELSYTGAQLKERGVVENVDDIQALAQLFTERHGMKPDRSRWDVDPVSRFFFLSQIEEDLRRKVGALCGELKILISPEGKWQWQGKSQKPCDPELIREARLLIAQARQDARSVPESSSYE